MSTGTALYLWYVYTVHLHGGHGFVSQVCVHVRSGGEGHVPRFHQQDRPALLSHSSIRAQRRAMSMALYLRYVYMCAVGEKGMFAIPISKTDQRFFPFQPRGSEEGNEQ
jgi:hypothetical protein